VVGRGSSVVGRGSNLDYRCVVGRSSNLDYRGMVDGGSLDDGSMVGRSSMHNGCMVGRSRSVISRGMDHRGMISRGTVNRGMISRGGMVHRSMISRGGMVCGGSMINRSRGVSSLERESSRSMNSGRILLEGAIAMYRLWASMGLADHRGMYSAMGLVDRVAD